MVLDTRGFAFLRDNMSPWICLPNNDLPIILLTRQESVTRVKVIFVKSSEQISGYGTTDLLAATNNVILINTTWKAWVNGVETSWKRFLVMREQGHRIIFVMHTCSVGYREWQQQPRRRLYFEICTPFAYIRPLAHKRLKRKLRPNSARSGLNWGMHASSENYMAMILGPWKIENLIIEGAGQMPEIRCPNEVRT